MTINELLEKWGKHMRVLRGMTDKSVRSYRGYVVEFIDWYKKAYPRPASTMNASYGGVVFAQVRRQEIEGYLEHLFYDAGNSNSTRKTKLICLRSFWRWMLYEGVVPDDVTFGIPTPIVRSRLIQSFTRQEVIRMFSEVDIYSAKGMRDICILILLAFCGLRIGELCGLRLEDLADDGDYVRVHIPEDIGKRGSSRVVDLWKAPSIFLRQWVAMRLSQGCTGSSSVMVSFRRGDLPTGNPLADRQVDRIVKEYADAARIRKPRITSHMFRATHASDLRYIRGYDIAAIAERLGHRNIATTDRYLPQRGRLKKEYASLREYWIDFEKIWSGGGREDGTNE